MDAVAFPVVSKRNQLNFQLIPLTIIRVVWERPHSEREEWTSFPLAARATERPNVSIKSGTTHYHQANFLESQFSIQRKPVRGPAAKLAEFMAIIASFAGYAYEGLILPAMPASSTSSPGAQRPALGAAMIEVAICHHHLLGNAGASCLAVHQARPTGSGRRI